MEEVTTIKFARVLIFFLDPSLFWSDAVSLGLGLIRSNFIMVCLNILASTHILEDSTAMQWGKVTQRTDLSMTCHYQGFKFRK